MRPAVLLGVLSIAVGGVAAWGKQGHMAVGFVAMQFLGPKASSFVKESLGDEYHESLANAADWADTIRGQARYKWSSELHFMDAHDNPLHGNCNVDVARDTVGGRTLLNAITNYTLRVQDENLSDNQRQEALKFLDHFIGDIGQPLHLEEYKRGANDVHAKCDGETKKLHAIWDTGLIEVMLNAHYDGPDDTEAWASDLAKSIKNGIYTTSAPGWISCSSTTQPVRRRGQLDELEVLAGRNTIAPLACPWGWAAESNAYCCSIVFSYGEDDDLCTGGYYDHAISVINEQVAKQGYRLAAWLNVIFDGSPIAFADGPTAGVLVEQSL